jgi:hypothetical protein
MKKPEQQWETARFVAVRLPEVPPERAGEPAVQAFELRRRGGGASARACFSLTKQVVDAEAADPDLEFAARAWLASRGGRSLDLRDALAGGRWLRGSSRWPTCRSRRKDLPGG